MSFSFTNHLRWKLRTYFGGKHVRGQSLGKAVKVRRAWGIAEQEPELFGACRSSGDAQLGSYLNRLNRRERQPDETEKAEACRGQKAKCTLLASVGVQGRNLCVVSDCRKYGERVRSTKPASPVHTLTLSNSSGRLLVRCCANQSMEVSMYQSCSWVHAESSQSGSRSRWRLQRRCTRALCAASSTSWPSFSLFTLSLSLPWLPRPSKSSVHSSGSLPLRPPSGASSASELSQL